MVYSGEQGGFLGTVCPSLALVRNTSRERLGTRQRLFGQPSESGLRRVSPLEDRARKGWDKSCRLPGFCRMPTRLLFLASQPIVAVLVLVVALKMRAYGPEIASSEREKSLAFSFTPGHNQEQTRVVKQ